MTLQKRIFNKRSFGIFAALMVLTALSYMSSVNFLLFHVISEGFSIVVAFAVFILAVNSWQFLKNNVLKIVGIAYFFVAVIDFIHMITYKGMSIIPGYDADTPTQLWVIARFVESISLMAAFSLHTKKINGHLLFALYTVVTGGLIFLVFTKLFPHCYIEGQGLTTFKKISEYLISGIFIITIVAVIKKRFRMEQRIMVYIILSLVFSVIGELFFTFYISVYGISNIAGHLFKTISFYYIYKIVINEGLKNSHRLLFTRLQIRNRELEQIQRCLEENVKESEEKFKVLCEMSAIAIFMCDGEGKLIYTNPFWQKYTGLSEKDALGTHWIEWVHPADRGSILPDWQSTIKNGNIWTKEFRSYTKGGDSSYVWSTATPIKSKKGDISAVVGITIDIMAQKDGEKKIRQALHEKEVLLQEVHHRTKNNMQIISAMLNLESLNTDNEEMQNTLTKLNNRIQCIALIHQRLYNTEDLTSINFREYIYDITGLIYDSFGVDDSIKMIYDLEDIEIFIHAAIPCGLVLNELVTNVYKYAFLPGEEGKLNITTRRFADKSIELVISDDGIGLPAGFDPLRSESLGLTLVYETVRTQLKGEIVYSSIPEEGTVWTVRFHDERRN